MAKSERSGKPGFNRKDDGRRFDKKDDRGGRQGQKDGERPFRKANEGERPFRPGKSEGGEGAKPFRKRSEGRPPMEGRDRKPFRQNDDKPSFRKSDDRPSFRKSDDKPSYRKSDDRPSYRKSDDRPYRRKDEGQQKEGRPFGKPASRGERKPFGNEGDRPAKPFQKRDGQRDDDKRPFRRSDDQADQKPFRKDYGGGERPFTRKREDGDRPADRGDKPFRRRDEAGQDRKPYDRKIGKPVGKKPNKFDDNEFDEYSNPAKPGKWDTDAKAGPMTLNKYLAHAGVASRRDAATIIKEGKVTVNGQVLTEPGYRVQAGDKIAMDGKELKPQRHFVYVLLNKPKDFITTTEDDRGRRTVMELVSGATEDRLYPVGRLDRNTTGVLLLTNDGDLAQKLSHPKYECKKIYQVSLDKDVTKRDFDKILEGVTLEDGLATVDRLAYLDKKSEIGLEIHSGRNRIVRRIFEHLGYDVVKLDRVMYAGLTKKNVSRGKWRFLSEKEVIQLKHFRT